VDKGFHKNEFIPVKPLAGYDMSVWGKTLNYPDGSGHWRDMNGWFDPAGEQAMYAVGDKNNLGWKEYKWRDDWRNNQGMWGGGSQLRYIIETKTGEANDNQMAYDDILFTERITPSRIPANA
jgi:hypothetical protein